MRGLARRTKGLAARWHSAEALRGLFERMGSKTRVAVPLTRALHDMSQA